ncbi:MAG TPA: tetratricopeptide repeat protein [Terriglobales bacterium]
MSENFKILHDRWRIFLERKGVPELVLVLITLAVYARSLAMGLVYDDAGLIQIPKQLTWHDVVVLFTQNTNLFHGSNFYRPLTGLWQALVRMVAGESSVGWHASELLLHLLCAVLVFRFVLELLKNREWALFAAAVFALHPTHVEVVTWCSDAGDMLLAIFLLLSALSLMRWLKAGGGGWWFAAWVSATACCFIKETGVLMPALLIALAFAIESEVSQPSILLTGLTMAASSGAFLILRNQILQGFAHSLSKMDDRNLLLTEPAAVWFYFSHLTLPIKLGPFYPLEFVSSVGSKHFIVPVLLLLVLVVFGLLLIRRLQDKRFALMCIVWATVPLVAPLYLKVFPDFELVHDRYLYIPSIALGIALAVVFMHFRGSQNRQTTVTAIACVILAAAALQTLVYQGVWRSNLTLFERAVEMTPNNDRAIVNLAVARVDQGKLPEAKQLFLRALELRPDNAFALFDLGRLSADTNNPQVAVGYLKGALQIEARPEWMVILANEEYKLGNTTSANFWLRRALSIDPNTRGAHLGLGWLMLNQGNRGFAIREFMAELQLTPDDPNARYGLQVAQGGAE